MIFWSDQIWFGAWMGLIANHADMWQIASLLGKVDAVTDDKFIWNIKADPVHMDINLAA